MFNSTLHLKLATFAIASAILFPTHLRADDKSPAAPATQPAKTKEQRKQEETARVMEFFRVTQPDVYEQAKSLRDNDTTAFEKMIHSAANTVNKLEDLHRRNPALFDLRMKDFELAYRSLKVAKEIKRPDITPSDRDQLTKDLTDLVSTQFDLRQKIRQLEIDDVQKQLADLSQQLQDRKADKDTLIKKRVDDLIETVPRLEW